MIGDEHPDAQSHQFGEETTVDLGAVKRIRRYIWYAIVGSVAVVLIEQVLLSESFGEIRGAELTGTEFGLLSIGAVILGVLAGFVSAVVGR